MGAARARLPRTPSSLPANVSRLKVFSPSSEPSETKRPRKLEVTTATFGNTLESGRAGRHFVGLQEMRGYGVSTSRVLVTPDDCRFVESTSVSALVSILKPPQMLLVSSSENHSSRAPSAAASIAWRTMFWLLLPDSAFESAGWTYDDNLDPFT